MIYIANVIECLKELSDVEFQRRLWVEGIGPEVSTIDELLSQLFDDTGLGDSIESGSIAMELGEDAASTLVELEAAINRLDRTLAPNCLVESPGMIRVRELATEAITKLVAA